MVNSNVCVDIFPEASATLSVMATNGEFNDLHSSLQTATPNFHFMSKSFTNQSNKNLKAHRHKDIYIKDISKISHTSSNFFSEYHVQYNACMYLNPYFLR